MEMKRGSIHVSLRMIPFASPAGLRIFSQIFVRISWFIPNPLKFRLHFPRNGPANYPRPAATQFSPWKLLPFSAMEPRTWQV